MLELFGIAKTLSLSTRVKAHHRWPHDGVLAAWADAMRTPANAPVVHGDKDKPELTRQYNEGYKTDLAEPMRARAVLKMW